MTSPITVSRALASCGLVLFEAKVLLAHVLGRDRSWLAAHGDAPLTREQSLVFDGLARRRRDGEPVAYLTGRREFYGLDLEVTPDVLIPRPETELLVELALARLPVEASSRVLDLGTGSGAVALAIARERPRAAVLATDVSAPAVALARRNARRLEIDNAQFIVSDWFAAVPPGEFELIIANPPYVAGRDPHLSEGDLRFEPTGALTPGGDALAAIRIVVAEAPTRLSRGAWLFVEHGYDQAEAVQALLCDAGFADVQSARDLAGILRATGGRFDQRPPL